MTEGLSRLYPSLATGMAVNMCHMRKSGEGTRDLDRNVALRDSTANCLAKLGVQRSVEDWGEIELPLGLEEDYQEQSCG